MSAKLIRGYCTLCRSRCGTLNEVQGDNLIAVRPDSEHPTGKAMCLKGKAAPELVDNADRLRHPMRRTQPKGAADPGWVQISWGEALDEIAGRMADIKSRSGAEAFAFGVTTPSGTPLSDSIDWIERLIRRYGSPNTCYATEICNWHKDFAHMFTFGSGMPAADYAHAGLIMLWGHNPTNTWLAQAHAIGEGRRAGAKLLVVDPRETALAKQADVWLRVRPGSDAALAMGIANLLLNKGGFDHCFVQTWSNAPALVRCDNGRFLRADDLGLKPGHELMYWDSLREEAAVLPRAEAGEVAMDYQNATLRGRFQVRTKSGLIECQPVFELYAQACAAYTPKRTAELTWVSEEDLHQAATLISEASSVAYHSWSGVGQQSNATQNERAIACLYALTGSYDAAGGNQILRKPPYRPVSGLDLVREEQRVKALGYDKRPLGPPAQGWITSRDLYESITTGAPYRVEGMLAFGTNLLSSHSDTALGIEALKSLDFYAHCDLFLNPSSHYADLVLPVNTPWEREGLRIGFEVSAEAEQHIQLRQQMVSSRGEARSDNDIVFALVNRLGFADDFFGGTLEQGWNAMLEPSGLTVDQLRKHPEGISVSVVQQSHKYGNTGFATPTGKVEFYSERLLEHGYPPLPNFVAEQDLMATDSHFPYVLTSAKSGYFCHSQQRSVASLRRKSPSPLLDISPELAWEKGIADQDWVRVTTRMGSARFRARLIDSLHPRVLVGEFGWWQSCVPLGQPAMPVLGEDNSNYNSLIDTQRVDPVSGSVPLRAFTCDVSREASEQLQPSRWKGYRPFVITALDAQGEDVTQVSMEPIDGGLLTNYESGQHVTIRLDVTDPDQGLITPRTIAVRSYSLTGPAVEPGKSQYQIAVRHAKARGPMGEDWDGLVSKHINQRLKIGDRVELQAPSGTFVIPVHSSRPLVFYAGGIGITPFLCALETAVAAKSKAEMLLLYGNRNHRGHAFEKRLKELQSHLPGLKIINVYSEPEVGAALNADVIHGYLNLNLVEDNWMARRALHYMCGPPVMMKALTEGLLSAGVPRFDVFKEIFRSPVAPKIEANGTFEITFSRSGKTHTWTSEAGPLLTFSENLGIELPSGCRVGQCESCAVRVLKGEVSHLHGSEPEDPEICLACQAIPTTNLTLDA
ncbi:molybdopterin-dependent oxidoreductase [Pseudomonas sp. 1152_12]|uniref:molybdopterin-dependent oxidoreductase n=1 Tax=Pseudomonas sp. 1152_12 TaxID=2604455 RepID=UPI004062DAF3